MKNEDGVLLAIPVYNEQEHLNDVLDKVTGYMKHVVVIDDGSTDQSRFLLGRRKDICVLSHKENQGYGRAIIQALHWAKDCGFDWVITMDCDLQHEPAQIPDFLQAIQTDQWDVISGSRYLPGSDRQGQVPADRKRINQAVTEMINSRLGLSLTDAFCGFKACRVGAAEKLMLREHGYGFPLEFWVQLARHGLRVGEIPVHLIYRDPNRHFGGRLDDPDTRLRHYQQVFDQAIQRAGI